MDKYTEPDYENITLLTIDTQNDFSLKGAICEVKGTYNDVIPNMVKLLQRFREKRKTNNPHRKALQRRWFQC